MTRRIDEQGRTGAGPDSGRLRGANPDISAERGADAPGPAAIRSDRGRRAHLAGKSAEDRVMQAYLRHGHTLVARRWRGPAGEIDLVLERDGEVVFVEVKSARTLARAVAHLTGRQIARLLRSAEHCLGSFPKGALTPMRFDVALVDGAGRLEVIPNALAT